MTVTLGCIADDFTGATDLAGLLARGGARVNLRLGVPDEADDVAPFEVVALKIRTVPVADAVAAALAALDWLRAAGARRILWKYCSTFDSTPDGNIGPVAEALMAALGTGQTIYCPAFPENGRSVYMGNLFVGRQPLAESPMRDHPLTPMRDSDLTRLLAPQVTLPVGLIDRTTVARGATAVKARLDDLTAHGVAHVVTDAVDDDDLAAIAAACVDLPLLTGGSAIAAPLPALYRAGGLSDDAGAAAAQPRVGPGAIVLSGSCSAMTRAQVAVFAKGVPSLHLDPVVLDRDGPDHALRWHAALPPDTTAMIYATAPPDMVGAAQSALGVQRAGEVVEAALAEIAVQALERGTRRFVVAGGETSGAVATALGVRRLSVGAEIAPGVPWTHARAGGHDIALALKSGNFGADTFFADALAALP